jgi:hypothetical protein
VSTYAAFLARKAQLSNAGGFQPVDLPQHLFDFQVHLVAWAVRQGRGAIFADCGLGKTPMELAWAEQVHRHTGKPVLLLTPLAVGPQIITEAEKFGHDAARSRDGSIPAPITVTNYEQLHRFTPSDFGGVVCDESSILKSFDGATKAAVTSSCAPSSTGYWPQRRRRRTTGRSWVPRRRRWATSGTWTCSAGSSSTRKRRSVVAAVG